MKTGLGSGSAADLIAAAPSEAPPAGLPRDVGWAVLRNTGAQATGRLLVALSRLVIASLIVRGSGQLTFAEYSLVLSLLAIAEWVTDFGLSEVAVREICCEPGRRSHLLRIVAAAKLVQVPAAYALLVILLAVLGYPRRVVEAGLLGGLGVALYAGVVVYRTLFKATLTMEREMAAEVLSVLAMLPLVGLAAGRGAGVGALLACQVASRGVFLAGALALGSRGFSLTAAGVGWAEVRAALTSSAAIGFVGLLAVVYQTVDVLVLSKFDLAGLAYYAAAQRLVWPIQMSLAALGTSLYPVLATHWPQSAASFEGVLQKGLDAALVLAGLAFSSFLAAPRFFLGIVGPELTAGSSVLQVLAVLGLAKAISSVLGPVLFVVHAQAAALRFLAVAVALKTVALLWLAPRLGFLGVAYGALAVEVAFAALPTVVVLQRATGYRIRWSVLVRICLIAATAVALTNLAELPGPVAAVLAPAFVVVAILASGTVRPSDLAALIRRRHG